jgi:hypothetical protein
MMFTPHALVGAAIGSVVPSPIAAFIGGFISHHLLDMMPHFDQGSFRLIKPGVKYLGGIPERTKEPFTRRDWFMLFADWALSLILFAIVLLNISWGSLLSIALGTLGGLTPDLINNSPLWSQRLEQRFAWVKKYNTFHNFFHWTVMPKAAWFGILTQVITISIALAVLLHSPALAFFG